ncbi:MAG: protein-L-isoaspartate O-methyltransferase [Thiohalomonadaceae bacterium]
MLDTNLTQARQNMITQQIRPWGVTDAGVLKLMSQTPRENFVPPQYRQLAFVDMAIPIGNGQVMMPPRLEARLLQALAIKADEIVLEIGTGRAYLTALLAQLAHHVYSVEQVAELKQAAELQLAAQGLDNITLELGDALNGWPQHGSYNVIVVTGSLPVLPQELLNSLAIGGRLFAVVGETPVMQARLVTRKSEHEWEEEIIFETELPPLFNAPQAAHFSL